jgi:hypothetical protein
MSKDDGRVSLAPLPIEALWGLSERERKLQFIGDVIAHWIKFQTGQSEAAIDDDMHVMLNGYEGAPPCWPSVGVLARWLQVLRDSGSDAERGDALAAPSEGSQSGTRASAGIAQPPPPSSPRS